MSRLMKIWDGWRKENLPQADEDDALFSKWLFCLGALAWIDMTTSLDDPPMDEDEFVEELDNEEEVLVEEANRLIRLMKERAGGVTWH